jgi:hypothetical protein
MYIYTACDRVRASQPALISEASTLIGWPPSGGHCINMRLQARSKHSHSHQSVTAMLQEKHESTSSCARYHQHCLHSAVTLLTPICYYHLATARAYRTGRVTSRLPKLLAKKKKENPRVLPRATAQSSSISARVSQTYRRPFSGPTSAVCVSVLRQQKQWC